MDLAPLSPPSSSAISAGGRYMSYMPHSGFHNQRIALENALTLASILNRTLLLPPARLGLKPAIHYAPSNTLWKTLLSAVPTSNTSSPEQCSINPNNALWCEPLGDATHVPWHWLVDFTSFGPSFNVWAPATPSYPWYDGAEPLLSNDTADFFDSSVYSHRIVDIPTEHSTSLGRYSSPLDLETLRNVSARHLRLGSLFGSARLRFRETRNIAIRSHVRAHVRITNSIIESLSNIVVDKLGGRDKYVSAHVRVNDRQFESRGGAQAAWFLLVSRLLGGHDLAKELELLFFNATTASDEYYLKSYNPARAIPPRVPEPVPARAPHLNLPCTRRLHEEAWLAPLNVPLFLASDARPDDPRLSKFMRTFPCTFTLAELLPFDSPVPLPTTALSSLHEFDPVASHTLVDSDPHVLIRPDQLHSSFDGAPLISHLAPLLDAHIAAQAATVAGTPESTFSSHILDVGWPTAHERQITQRG
ncbi:unnamed protein product [Peniophora sp. CBMAI 1063]|nr:unnamed protein product [Peniophora sp. CBMAI 1063]